MTRSPSFFRNLRFGDGRLRVSFGGENESYGSIAIDYVRCFSFFKESDFHSELAREGSQEIVIDGAYPSVKLFKIVRDPLLRALTSDRFDHEQPLHFLVWTPDECIEVTAFEEPKITLTPSGVSEGDHDR